MFSYESLEIWRLAIAFAKDIYQMTNEYPIHERYGLISQLRRAAISISSNIAEGSGAVGYKDKLNYLDISIKSALEVTSEIALSYELGYITTEQKTDLLKQAEILIKMIRAVIGLLLLIAAFVVVRYLPYFLLGTQPFSIF